MSECDTYTRACASLCFGMLGERRRKKDSVPPLGSVDGKTAEEGNPKITRPDSNGDVSFCTVDAAFRTPFSTRAKEERATIIITRADRPVYLYTRQTNYLYAFYRRHYTREKKIYLIRRAIMDSAIPPKHAAYTIEEIITYHVVSFLLLCTVPLKTCTVLPFGLCG